MTKIFECEYGRIYEDEDDSTLYRLHYDEGPGSDVLPLCRSTSPGLLYAYVCYLHGMAKVFDRLLDDAAAEVLSDLDEAMAKEETG